MSFFSLAISANMCDVEKIECEKCVNNLFNTLGRKADHDGEGTLALTMSGPMKPAS